MHFYAWDFRHFDSTLYGYSVVTEESIGTDTKALVICNIVADLVSSVAFVTIISLSDIVREL